MATYKCPKCGQKAEIDKEAKKVSVQLSGPGFRFPLHADCELVKGVDDINLDKLEKV